MTRRRWIADEYSVDRAALTGAHAAHLARTLRTQVGHEFELVCGDQVRRGTVVSVADDRVEFALGEQLQAQAVVSITLLLAIFKFDRMEWAIEKCTELNVTNIVPVIVRRTEKHLAAAAEKRVERWRRIAREASEQSRRATPPQIATPIKLHDVLNARKESKNNSAFQKERTDELPANEPRRGGSEVSPGRKPWVGVEKESSPVGTAQNVGDDLRIVLDETERTVMLAEVLRANGTSQSLTLAIGPEGGWTADELRLFARAHWIAASLGATILRAETAAVAATAIARAEISGEI